MAEVPKVHDKLRNFIGAIKVLQGVVDAPQGLESSSTEANFDQAQHNFFTSVKLLHDNITKFTLGVKDAEKLDEMAGLADLIEKDCTNVVSMTQTLVVVMKAHKAIMKKLFVNIRDALDAIIELAEAMLNKKYEGNNINRLTGVVWKCCDELEATNLDAKAVLLKDIQGQMGTMKDALEELEEAANADEDDGADDFGDDFGDDFDGLGEQKLSASDKKVVPGCVLMLKTAGSLAAQVVKHLASVQFGAPSESHLPENQATAQWLSLIYDSMAELADLVDELVQSVYPPQQKESVVTMCKRMSTLMLKICGWLKDSNGRVPPAVSEKLEQTIKAFTEKALEML